MHEDETTTNAPVTDAHRDGRRRGITIYPASGAVDNATSGFRGQTRVAPETDAQLRALRAEGYSAGLRSMMLCRQTDDEGGFSMLLVGGKPNYAVARHSHSSDCMYYVVSGSATMGNVTLRPGDSFFTPAGAPYQWRAGPEGVEILEVRRHVDEIGIDLHDISPAAFEHEREVVAANREQWVTMDVSPTFALNDVAADEHGTGPAGARSNS